MSYDDSKPAAIIDMGTGTLKCGTSTNTALNAVIRTCVGTPSYESLMPGFGTKEYYIGPQAQAYRGVCAFNWPMEHGVIKDWDAMDKIWKHVFNNEMRVDVGNEEEDNNDVMGVFLTEPPRNPHAHREKVAEHMFGQLNVRRLYVGIQGVLSLFGAGKTSGLSLCSGDGVTAVVPVYHGIPMTHAVQRSNFGGRDITNFLTRRLQQAGLVLQSSSEQMTVTKIKEAVCHVSLDSKTYQVKDLDTMLKDMPSKEYTLPDNSKLTVKEAQFSAPELLFRPIMAGNSGFGVHQLIEQAFNAVDVETRNDMIENIVLSGGNTLFPNFAERLEDELKHTSIYDETNAPKMGISLSTHNSKDLPFEENWSEKFGTGDIASTTFDVYNGACVLCQLSTFDTMWMRKSKWDEEGASMVSRFEM